MPENVERSINLSRRLEDKKWTYAISAVENERDVCRLGDVIRARRQVDRLDRPFPYACGLLCDQDLPKPLRSSAEVEKVPWIEIGHDLSGRIFTISFSHIDG